METSSVLAAFNAQVRRGNHPDGSGPVIEAGQHVVRCSVADDGQGWAGVTWSQLDEASADRVIATQVGYFGDRGQRFEWKLYDYDQPPDLAQRLLAAGFVPGAEETLMVAEVSTVPAEVTLPAQVRLLPVADEAGVSLLIDVHDRAFGTDYSEFRQSLLTMLRNSPDVTTMVVAMAGREPICSGRIEFLPGSDFAGLWGGGTVPGWRGRGIYRALVGYRAQLAAARGYRYLQVDASPDSRPILERLGFAALARTTPYVWDPGGTD